MVFICWCYEQCKILTFIFNVKDIHNGIYKGSKYYKGIYMKCQKLNISIDNRKTIDIIGWGFFFFKQTYLKDIFPMTQVDICHARVHESSISFSVVAVCFKKYCLCITYSVSRVRFNYFILFVSIIFNLFRACVIRADDARSILTLISIDWHF